MEISEDELNAKIQEAVEAATRSLTDKHDADIKGLKSKNAELLSTNKNLKSAADEAETAKLEASTNIEDIKKAHQRQLDRLASERDDAITARDRLMIDNVIAADLVKHNVGAVFHPMLTTALKAQAKVIDGAAMIEGQPLSDHIADFVNSDTGKHYVAAPINSGSGATGSTKTNATQWTTFPTTHSEFVEFQKLANTNPALYNSLCDQFNKPELKL